MGVQNAQLKEFLSQQGLLVPNYGVNHDGNSICLRTRFEVQAIPELETFPSVVVIHGGAVQHPFVFVFNTRVGGFYGNGFRMFFQPGDFVLQYLPARDGEPFLRFVGNPYPKGEFGKSGLASIVVRVSPLVRFLIVRKTIVVGVAVFRVRAPVVFFSIALSITIGVADSGSMQVRNFFDGEGSVEN